MPGFAAAFVAAFVWAGYSVLSRRSKAVPTDAVAGFCLATAVLAALCTGSRDDGLAGDDAAMARGDRARHRAGRAPRSMPGTSA